MDEFFLGLQNETKKRLLEFHFSDSAIERRKYELLEEILSEKYLEKGFKFKGDLIKEAPEEISTELAMYNFESYLKQMVRKEDTEEIITYKVQHIAIKNHFVMILIATAEVIYMTNSEYKKELTQKELAFFHRIKKYGSLFKNSDLIKNKEQFTEFFETLNIAYHMSVEVFPEAALYFKPYLIYNFPEEIIKYGERDILEDFNINFDLNLYIYQIMDVEAYIVMTNLVGRRVRTELNESIVMRAKTIKASKKELLKRKETLQLSINEFYCHLEEVIKKMNDMDDNSFTFLGKRNNNKNKDEITISLVNILESANVLRLMSESFSLQDIDQEGRYPIEFLSNVLLGLSNDITRTYTFFDEHPNLFYQKKPFVTLVEIYKSYLREFKMIVYHMTEWKIL